MNDLCREVRVVLDKNATSDALIALDDIDTLSVEEIIRSKIEEGARIVENNAPHHLLDSGRAFGESIWWEEQKGIGMGSIHLPDDFLRLVSFRMSDWAKSVTEVITEDDDEYAVQRSRYGVRGNPQRPVVAIVQEPIGLVLEFYTCTAGEDAYVRYARYIPIPKIRNNEIEICEKLKPAVIYYIGYLTALTLGDAQTASILQSVGNRLAEIEEQPTIAQ